MSDFNSSYYTPPYIPPSYFIPPPPPPMITPENPGAANAYYQQQQQQIANSGGAGYVPFNPATSPNTAPSGMTYPGAGMVQPYPSFGEASGGGGYDPYTPEQAFSPSGGAGGYSPLTPARGSPEWYGGGWDQIFSMPNADAATFWQQQAPTNYVPEQSWGGYTPAADFSDRFPVSQSQSPPWQPLPSVFDTGTSPTPYFNDFLVPQYSAQMPARGSADWYGGGWDQIYGGGGAAAAAAPISQGNVYGGGAASAAPAYTPPAYSPPPNYSAYVPEQAFSPSGSAGGYTPPGAPPRGSAEWYGGGWDQISPTSFDDRFSAAPPIQQGLQPMPNDSPYSFPPAITAGVQPSADVRVPDNFNSRYGPMEGEQTYSPSDFPGWTPPVPGAPPRGSAEWYGGGWDQISPGGGSAYNPFQQYQNSGYDPFVSSYENDANQILQQIDRAPAPSYAPPDTLQPGDYGGMPARGSADWYGQGWDQIPESSLNAMNATRDAAARALMAQPKPPADLGGATVTPSPDFTSNNPTLAEQRAPFAETIRNDPAKALQLAARLYSEDQNNADSRVGILEAMLNRYNATGQDPFNPTYYPTDTKQYTDALNKLSSDNALLNQVYQEMERAWGGSNVSNYATDWGSGPVAETGRTLGTPTWISPTSEQFYRKDINNDWAGSGIAKQNQDWYLRSSTTNR